MASANLDLVRSIYADWERGNFSSAGWAHPEIEFAFADQLSAGNWTGRTEMARAWREYLSTWTEFHTEAQQFRQLDNERVLVLTKFGGRGKTSGLTVEKVSANGASLFHVRDGEVTRLVLYWDRSRALADLGLAPETTS